MGTLVWLVMTTGMRRGEVLALRWRHVHFDRRVLDIRRNYVQRRGRKIEKDTKTHQMRRIALDQDTIVVLEEHRDRALHRARLLEVASTDDWYLFSNDPAHGRPLNCGTTARPSCSAPASTRPRCPAGSATAGEVRPPCASTRPGWRPPTNEQPRCWAPKCRNGARARRVSVSGGLGAYIKTTSRSPPSLARTITAAPSSLTVLYTKSP